MNPNQADALTIITNFLSMGVGVLITIIVVFLILRPGGFIRFFLGQSGEENLKDWKNAHDKAKDSRAEVEAVLRKNEQDPSKVNE